MKIKSLYLVLCVVGLVIPYYELLHFLYGNGLDFGLFFQQLSANHISNFFAIDVVVSAVVLIIFATAEGIRLRMKLFWIPIIGTFLAGVSFGLPLFLYLRQLKMEKNAQRTEQQI